MSLSNIRTDTEAMDEIEGWMKRNDPDLTGDIPGWVWSLVCLIDDMIDETGRNG